MHQLLYLYFGTTSSLSSYDILLLGGGQRQGKVGDTAAVHTDATAMHKNFCLNLVTPNV